MEVGEIYATLARLTRGSELRLRAAAFGPGALEGVLSECCDGGELRLGGVSLTQTPSEVKLSGTGANAPFSEMPVEARFTPGSGEAVSMTLTAAPPASWTLAASWPSLLSSIFARIAFSDASLTLGTGDGSGRGKGLAFEGTAELGCSSPWGSLSWLLGDLARCMLSGSIQIVGGVPVFSASATAGSVSLPLLGELKPTLTLGCAALQTKAEGQTSYAPVPELSLEAELQLGPGVGIAIDLSNPAGLIGVQADVTKLSSIGLEELGDLVGVRDLGGFLPETPEFKPAGSVRVVDLGFTLNPKRQSVVSTQIELGTSLQWKLTDHIEIKELLFELVVPVSPPPGTPAVFATAFGVVSLPGGELDISGAYGSDFQLVAGLREGSKVKLTDLLDLFLPTKLDAELYLDKLEMIAATSGSWSLLAGLKGDWGFSVGIVRVALAEAWIQLEHGGDEVSGTISGTALLGSGSSAPRFSGAWTLPRTFALSGSFPEIDLGSLAATLTGGAPPSGLPEIDLTDANAKLTLATDQGHYDFALAASASMAGHGELGRAAFEVRKDGSGFGFLVGLALAPGWSPGQIWHELSAVFGALQFGQSGLVVSTLSSASPDLDVLSMPSVPPQVGPGATFFTSLALKGAGIGYLAEVLPSDSTLDLLAVVDTAAPGNSSMSASLRQIACTGDIEFQRLALTFRPNPFSISLDAQAALHLEQGEAKTEVVLKGAGTIAVDPPDLELELIVEHWPEPFGIKRLTVEKFGLEIGVQSGCVHVGALGEIAIDQFLLEIGADFEDFEAPDAIVFELRGRPGETLMLSSVIEEFTTLDVSKVPVLGGIGFEDLKLWLIGNPAGWKIGGYTFPPGIAVHADVSLYSWRLTLDVEVHTDHGVKASGAVDKPIEVGDVLTISNADGTAGPAAGIDTSPFAAYALPAKAADPYLWLDGRVSFLQITQQVRAEVTRSAFEFDLEFSFLSAVKVTLACALSDGESFSASAAFEFDVDVTLGPYTWEGIELLPRTHISGPRGKATVGVSAGKSVSFKLEFGLAFDWGPIHVSISPEFTAADLGNDLSGLWPAVVAWMEANLGAVFSELLGNASKWVEAVKSGLIQVGANAEEMAKALAGYFDVGIEEAGKLLNQLGFAFEDVADALSSAFGVSVEEAERILGNLTKNCAISAAYAAIDPAAREPAPSRTLFDLTESPAGQRMLVRYYVHRSELAALARSRPEVAVRVRAIANPDDPDADARAAVTAGAEALRALRPHSSPELRAAIDETLPELDRRAGMSYDEFMEDLRR